MVIKPKRLKKGDKVGIIAPAGHPNMEAMQRGICFLEEIGLQVVVGKNLEKEYGYLAGTDQERLEDFHSMFANREIKAIICARGGYGSARYSSHIDFSLVKKNPKIFLGYSDITFLHLAIFKETEMVTFHGPMVCSDLGKVEYDERTLWSLLQLFYNRHMVYSNDISPLETIIEGVVKAPIVGGNLTLLTSSIGTRFEIDTTEKLLFIEEIGEEPRSIDRMLNQLWMAGKLAKMEGIMIGDFHDCKASGNASFSTDEVLHHYVQLAKKPALKGFKIGHCSPNIVLPLGVNATMNTIEKYVEIDSGVM